MTSLLSSMTQRAALAAALGLTSAASTVDAAVSIDANLAAIRELPAAQQVRQAIIASDLPIADLIAAHQGLVTRAVLRADDPRQAVTWQLATEQPLVMLAALSAAGLEPVTDLAAPAVRHPHRDDHIIAAGSDRIVIAPRASYAEALTEAWPARLPDNAEVAHIAVTPRADGIFADTIISVDAQLHDAGSGTLTITLVDEATARTALNRIENGLGRHLLATRRPVAGLIAEHTSWSQYGNTLTGICAVPPAEVVALIEAELNQRHRSPE